MEESGIYITQQKGEEGIGQEENNFQSTNAMEMADMHTWYKMGIKYIAEKHGYTITFMAQPNDQPFGNSCHLHVSLQDKNENNAFTGSEVKLADGKATCSPYLLYFLGGWMRFTPDFFLFYAPTVNSYKRFKKGAFEPSNLTWGYDNRTTSFRICGAEENVHIECRIPGSDVNPYLALSATILAGTRGCMEMIEPPEMIEGSAWDLEKLTKEQKLPTILGKACADFEKSEFVREVFGEATQQHYAHVYEQEYELFKAAVTDWERSRYFDQI